MPWPFGPRDALDFAVRCVTETFSMPTASLRALDVGCAVGRSTLELSRFCGEVIGIDYSSAFIRAAAAVASGGELDFEARVEGAIVARSRALRPSGVHPDRVRFETGDAMALREDLGAFDRVLAANLIDRLVDPRKFLTRTRDLVTPGGELVITSPYTWLEEFTPRAKWLGGTEESGVRPTLEALKEELGAAFDLVKTVDLPFVIREHARKYQWSVAQASVWRRHS